VYVDCRYVSWRTASEAFIRSTIEHEGQAGEEGEIMIMMMMLMMVMTMMVVMMMVVVMIGYNDCDDKNHACSILVFEYIEKSICCID
jgi:heme/copper-type cytochrome/quinol oxidase subunit 2